jgi:DNA modification methylase
MYRIEIGDRIEVMERWAAEGIVAQTCITSPPYWGLRDYGTGIWEGGNVDHEHDRVFARNGRGGSGPSEKQTENAYPSNFAAKICQCGARRVDQQVGLEETVDHYIEALVETFRAVRNILADDGTCWVVLGDSYAGSWGNQGRKPERGSQRPINGPMIQNVHDGQYPQATHTGSADRTPGYKPKDLIGIPWRVAFALQADRWYLRQDLIWEKPNPMPESVRDRFTKAHEYIFLFSKNQRYYFDHDAIQEPADPKNWRTTATRRREPPPGAQTDSGFANGRMYTTRNPRSVLKISTKPYKNAHFATFPPDLIRPFILAGSREGDTVLDPFMGSGTTAMVAEQLGRHAIGCELNPNYRPLWEARLMNTGGRNSSATNAPAASE